MALDPPPPGDPAPPMPSPRLDPPSLPANPNQLERGAYAYWLNCLPCHGDSGQGLTQEFRMLYPPDHQNCWTSGCHGERPYPNGWTLPGTVPALIGPGTLAQFNSAAALYAFVEASMPFQDPGSLDAETYTDTVAFLASKNGLLPDGQLLTPGDAGDIWLSGTAAESPAMPEPNPRPAHPAPEAPAQTPVVFWGLVLLGLTIGGVFLARDLRR